MVTADYGATSGVQRRVPARLRGLDHLETGVRYRPKRLSGRHRVRVHGAVRKVRYHRHTLRAWFILGVVSQSGAAGVVAIALKGHW